MVLSGRGVTPRSGLPAVKSPSAASMRGLGLFGILIPKETARRPLFYRRETCSRDVRSGASYRRASGKREHVYIARQLHELAFHNERRLAIDATGYDSTPTIEFTWSMILASMRGH
jgi:hypothetical protein